MLSSYSHVGCINDVFRMLLNGGTVLWYDLRKEGLAGLAPWMREQRATVYHSVPSVFRLFAHGLSPTDPLNTLRR